MKDVTWDDIKQAVSEHCDEMKRKGAPIPQWGSVGYQVNIESGKRIMRIRDHETVKEMVCR